MSQSEVFKNRIRAILNGTETLSVEEKAQVETLQVAQDEGKTFIETFGEL